MVNKLRVSGRKLPVNLDSKKLLNNSSIGILSRGKKKRALKHERLQRKYDMVNYLQELKDDIAREDSALNDLRSISKAIDEIPCTENTQEKTPAKPPKLTKAKRAKLALSEIEHFKGISKISAFRQRPVEAIRTHLQNTYLKKQKAKAS